MVANGLALLGLLISFCAAFVTAIPLVWYRTLKVVTVKTTSVTTIGDLAFSSIPSIDAKDFEWTLDRQRCYAIMGLQLLAIGVLYGCLGIF